MSGENTILVVEDDGDISDAIATCLADFGYEVWVAANGHEALNRLRAAPTLPGLILLDLMMPVMDGWQFRDEQVADPALADVPVVLLSAHRSLRDAAREMGGLNWLKKPVDLRELLSAVGVSSKHSPTAKPTPS